MKKILCFILSTVLITSSVSAFSSDILPGFIENENEAVTFIVEVEGEPALFAAETKTSYSIKAEEEKILDTQARVMSEIKENISDTAEKGFVYTSLFNGFSLEGEINQLEEIKALPGVKNVYISETIPAPELKLSNADELTGVDYAFENEGLDGEGQVIAVIDVGCDTGHEFFSTPPENPKLAKEDIDYYLKNNNSLNTSAESANQVYKSAKIPYAFNYVTGTADTYSHTSVHGTHVSGIAVGKDGTLPDGNKFSGIAPEAQLLFFNAGNEKGLSLDTIFAALNDAVYLGADVINMSFGIAYRDSAIDTLFEDITANAKEAGISVIVSAGNEARGYEMNTPLTTNIDYSTTGEPANIPAVTAVASANNKQLKTGGQISSFSSWGVDSTLELKPEITAPGGYIYSSVPDNKYAYLSGTSMASPHMAGVNALIRQYYSTNPFIESFNNLSGKDKVNILENIAMNSAEIIRDENGVAISPRVQGAGLVNMKNIINSKVILTGNSGKAKLSLGEINDNNFEIKFDITNISSDTVVFDDIDIELTTDGYTENNGDYYVGETVSFDYKNVTMPETITINSGETYNFTASVELDEAFLEENKKIFESGFFIDGFVLLKNNDESIKASLPFTGFYGDWYNIPIFDKTTYDEGGSTLIDAENPYTTGTHFRVYDEENDGFYFVGRNIFDNSIADKKYISFSNKSNFSLCYFFNYYRTTGNHIFSILNSDNENVLKINSSSKVNKFNDTYFKFSVSLFSSLEEGKYTFRVGASALGNTDVNDRLILPLVIDNTPPEINNITYDEESGNLTVYAKDNHYICGFIITYYLPDGTEKTKSVAVTDNDYIDTTAVKTISLSKDIDKKNIYVDCIDYALNETVMPLSIFKDNIGFRINSLTRIDEITSAKITLRNNTDEDIVTDVIISFYDENDRLISVSVKEDILINSKEESDISSSRLSDTTSSTKMKIFFWKPDTQTPVSNHKKISI